VFGDEAFYVFCERRVVVPWVVRGVAVVAEVLQGRFVMSMGSGSRGREGEGGLHTMA